MSAALSIKNDEDVCVRAALSGEVLGRVPRWLGTLQKIRELAREGMKRSVPHYCLDLVGQEGLLLKSDSDIAKAGGAFVDVVVVRRKVVCEECRQRMRCFCGARLDKDCECVEEVNEVNKLCSWCSWGLLHPRSTTSSLPGEG